MSAQVWIEGTCQWRRYRCPAWMLSNGIDRGEVEILRGGRRLRVGRTVRPRFVAHDGRTFWQILDEAKP